jgi:hypothetical protein
MSKSTEKPATSDQSSYTAPVDALLDRFDALMKHVQQLVFPPWRKGVTTPPDMTHWSRLRRIAFKISSPLLTTFKMESFQISFTILSAWVVATWVWVIIADSAVQVLKSPLTTVSKPEQTATRVELAVLVVAAVLAFGLIPAAYWRWIEFFRDRRYTGYWRLIRLILTLLFIASILVSFWGLSQDYGLQFHSRSLENRAGLILLAITYVLFLIPAGTFYYMLVIDTAVFGGSLLWAIFNYLISTHIPFPKKFIREIVLKPIPSSEDKEEWRLTELTKAELESLHRWAEANREGTDKRLLPTLVLFGILAVFANTQAFNRVLDEALAWLYRLPIELMGLARSVGASPGNTFIAYQAKMFEFIFIVILICLFILVPLLLLLLLFRNLVTQSLIIEACIVAEHVREQHRSVDSSIETITGHKGFWQWLVSLLWRC